LTTPGGAYVNVGLNAKAMSDEHSSVFPPHSLGNNNDYLFFLATDENGHAGIGMSVFSGSLNNGTWTLDYPNADGYGLYGGGFGQVFNSASALENCPTPASRLAKDQDQTFDLNYAAGGSVVTDPTASPGSLLMVYEGTNACVGNTGGARTKAGYISLAIATSLDYGKTWPTYPGTTSFNFVPLPDTNQNQGPNALTGALGPNVCMGNVCPTIPAPPPAYGRYPVVTITPSLESLITAGNPLGDKVGEQEISGFVDRIGNNPAPFLYANSGNVRIARAQLNGGTAPLQFWKWDGFGFESPGIGGPETSVLPTGPFANCEDPTQNQFGSSISYVEDTGQYLLTFVCDSPGDPGLGQQPNAKEGAAWFYSTSYELSDPAQWTTPQEITGSWNKFDTANSCKNYNGWYPTFMSVGKDVSHLSLTGYVFYLWGCQGAGSPSPPRYYSSRAFTITIASTR
jgi:hypothetical protein